jgi:hypothetical protein
LQFDAVDQKNGQRNFAFANVIEKGVLKVLRSFGCHCRCFPLFFAREPHRGTIYSQAVRPLWAAQLGAWVLDGTPVLGASPSSRRNCTKSCAF